MQMNLTRRSLLSGIAAGPILLGSKRSAQANSVGTDRAKRFPNLVYRNQEFEARELDQLKGTVSFVYMWASWCPICADDLLNIQWYWDKYQANPKFSLVVLNFLEPYETGLAWGKARKFTLPFSNSGIGSRNTPTGKTADGSYTFPLYTPQFFILDQNRIVREYTSRKRNAGDDVNRLLQKMLAEV